MAASETTLLANGLRHHVIRWGQGRVDVVLCHGFLDVAWSFDALARKLVDAGYGVASFDWRGHGSSEWIGAGGYYHFPDYVLDLDELLPQLSEEPVHLVGHSMGGGACALFAGARPERVRTLALVEGIGPPEREPTNPAKRLRAWLNGVARVRSGAPKPLADAASAINRLRVQNRELGDDLGAFLVAKSTVPAEGGLQWAFDPLHKTLAPRPFSAETFGQVLEAIEAPTLVVGGEHGFRLVDQEARIGRIANHERIEVPNVGHMVHWFAADALAEALRGFFARHPA